MRNQYAFYSRFLDATELVVHLPLISNAVTWVYCGESEICIGVESGIYAKTTLCNVIGRYKNCVSLTSTRAEKSPKPFELQTSYVLGVPLAKLMRQYIHKPFISLEVSGTVVLTNTRSLPSVSSAGRFVLDKRDVLRKFATAVVSVVFAFGRRPICTPERCQDEYDR
ncbi:hypothetical protein EVAR_47000_1 [Eumeta japonica]|uniref:Uncharacterized protein n=1 Tax=Eumeta variegata TaxID=151549 RepID=A0A4C1X9N2_EUMVA|nr:hypothetical protein EVAR_47000_1 [Eumeta japonica]